MSALSICETYIRRRAIRHMKKINLFLLRERDPYFSTDTAASAEVLCDEILKPRNTYNKDLKSIKTQKNLIHYLH